MDQILSDSAHQVQGCVVPGCHGSLFIIWHEGANALQLACIFDSRHPHRDLTADEEARVHPASKIKAAPDTK